MSMVLSLADCVGRAPEVGGKAAGLAALIAEGLPVPSGFCVTTDAYRTAVRAGNLTDRIQQLVGEANFATDNTATSRAVADLFAELELPAEIADPIRKAYAALGDDVHVAVRSSATAEDQADASFAGQQDTYLYVRGADAVVEHVVRCWASLFSPQAIGYRSRFGVDTEDLAMAVVVQTMVPADAAGVMMTLNPMSGDRSRIFIEATYGLGEGVVRGDVGADRFELDKDSLHVVEHDIATKAQAYRYVEAAQAVQLVDVSSDDQRKPCLSEEEVRAVGRLGAAIERAFGHPVDVEWAVAPGPSGKPEVYLLQARPETVWSQREPAPAQQLHADHGTASFDPFDDWDPLHTWSDPNTNWTRTNIGEAMPGVMTPLGWTLWSCAEGVFRDVMGNIGVLTREERAVPLQRHQWLMRSFYGRIAWQVDFFGMVGDRMPGTSAEQVTTSLLGRAAEGMVSRPTRRFYPKVAVGFPRVAATAVRKARRVTHETKVWHANVIRRAPDMNLDEARRTIGESREVFARILAAHGHLVFAVIQPLHDQLEAVVRRAGVGDSGTLSGTGGAEVTGLVNDMWEASRGRLTLHEILVRHGYHGPEEGEVSSRVWREDPTPLERMLEVYSARPEADSPSSRDAAMRHRRAEMIQDVLAALPRLRRPMARLVIELAARYIPMRGTCKEGMLQSIDACRAAARRAGKLLVQDGLLDDAEDVFFLTVDELAGTLPGDARELVARRRERHAAYRGLTIPGDWRGMPEPTSVADAQATAAATVAGLETIAGIGVSHGVVEGRARVVTSADFAEVTPGEVLVAPTTDPSWASIMFVSSALVVDIGGALSHAAVVARELGLPCVVNTRHGTAAIRSGDLVRVDGKSGIVEILERGADSGAVSA